MTTMTSNAPATGVNDQYKITKSDLIKSSLNVGSLGMEFSWTYYKQMNLAFCLMIAKMLKKIYHDRPEDYNKAIARHWRSSISRCNLLPLSVALPWPWKKKWRAARSNPRASTT